MKIVTFLVGLGKKHQNDKIMIYTLNLVLVMAHDSAEIHVDNVVDSISDSENQQLMDVRNLILIKS